MAELYTYYGGRKIELKKRPDQFIVRASETELESRGFDAPEKMSPNTSRIVCRDCDLDRLMNRAREFAPTHHAYEQAENGQEFLLTDRIFVKFREGTTSMQMDEMAAKVGIIAIRRYADNLILYQLTNHTGINPVKLVVKLSESEPIVESSEHDLNHRMTKFQVPLPTDDAYLRQWHLHNRSTSFAFDARSSARVEQAWQRLNGFGSSDVVIGVTDDGCKLDHPDFDSAGKFPAWGYFVGNRLIKKNEVDADPEKMFQSDATHGTSCAGVAAAEVDGVQTVGAAPGCRLAPIKWESSGPSLLISDGKFLDALTYLSDKVDVISNSWGSSPYGIWSTHVVDKVTSLAATGGRRGKGIVILFAAGNENCPILHSSTIDIPYDRGFTRFGGSLYWVGVNKSKSFDHNLVGIPGVMWIAALSSRSQRSHYSNYGPGVTLSAPSSNGHTYLRLTVEGLGVTTTSGPPEGLVTESFGGTSSATPLVAGVAALIISANPTLTSVEVVSVLKRTASKDLNMDAYSRTPPANYDLDSSWDVSPVAPFDSGDFSDTGDADGSWSPWFGHGRVDAEAAVIAASNGSPSPASFMVSAVSPLPGRGTGSNQIGKKSASTKTAAKKSRTKTSR